MVHAMCLLAEHIDNITPVEEKMQVFFFDLYRCNEIKPISCHTGLYIQLYGPVWHEKSDEDYLLLFSVRVKQDTAGNLGGKNPDRHEDAS